MLNWRKGLEQDKKNANHISTGIFRPPNIIVNPLLLPSEKPTRNDLKGFPNWRNPLRFLRALSPWLPLHLPFPLSVHHKALLLAVHLSLNLL